MQILTRSRLNLFLLAFSSVLLSNCSNSGDKEQPNDLTKKNGHMQSSLPAFTLQAMDGNIISSQTFHGNVLVVDFWATWCRPCITEIPKYNRLNAKYEGQDFRFVGITMDSGDLETIKPFVSKFAIQYPIYVGDSHVVDVFGGVQGYPTTFVIDKHGTIQKSYLGIARDKAEEIDALVEKLLRESS